MIRECVGGVTADQFIRQESLVEEVMPRVGADGVLIAHSSFVNDLYPSPILVTALTLNT